MTPVVLKLGGSLAETGRLRTLLAIVRRARRPAGDRARRRTVCGCRARHAAQNEVFRRDRARPGPRSPCTRWRKRCARSSRGSWRPIPWSAWRAPGESGACRFGCRPSFARATAASPRLDDHLRRSRRASRGTLRQSRTCRREVMPCPALGHQWPRWRARASSTAFFRLSWIGQT